MYLESFLQVLISPKRKFCQSLLNVVPNQTCNLFSKEHKSELLDFYGVFLAWCHFRSLTVLKLFGKYGLVNGITTKVLDRQNKKYNKVYSVCSGWGHDVHHTLIWQSVSWFFQLSSVSPAALLGWVVYWAQCPSIAQGSGLYPAWTTRETMTQMSLHIFHISHY